jgi:APA family basic amino acid/polyamine antiporter
MLGTGAFVSLAMAHSVTGPGVVLAVVLAAGLAFLNGLSSAQLAASHPLAGGTYEYAHQYARPWLGRIAGWMFLAAKSASAATAALACSAYVLHSMGLASSVGVPLLAFTLVGLLTLVVAGGVRRSNRANAILVIVTSTTLLALAVAALPACLEAGSSRWTPFFVAEGGRSPLAGLLEATALVFVAYTGYGRIATMGEEVRNPRRTIPIAILTVVSLSMVLYLVVAAVVVSLSGNATASPESAAAPLAHFATQLEHPVLAPVVAAGAVAAMLGVLLNLLLGLSRVYLAMARRGDMPRSFAQLNQTETTPSRAVLLAGVVVAGFICIGDVKIAWSFSAITVLVYYGITNYTALCLPPESRLYPRSAPACGLAGCLGLLFWVDAQILSCVVALIGAVFVWNVVVTYRRKARSS